MKSIDIRLIFCFGIFIITSCVPSYREINNPESEDEMIINANELTVPDDFNYNTLKMVHLNITMPRTIDFENYRSRFHILSTAGENGNSIFTGAFNTNGEYESILSVPMIMDTLYFNSVVTNTKIPLSSLHTMEEFVTINLEDFYDNLATDDYPIESNSDRIHTDDINNFNQKSTGLVNGDFSINDFALVQNFGAFTPNVNKWNFIIGGLGNTPMTWYEENGNGFVGTTNPGTHQYGVVQTFPVSAGDLIDFQAQVKAVDANGMHSFYRVFARNSNGGVLDFASLQYSFPDYDWTTKNVLLTMPVGTTYCTVEAIGGDWTPDGRILFDNFSVTGISDADGDGVEDELDEFPNDPDKAFTYYYPGEQSYGTLAFEDTWPSRGDYDFNDMVVDYQYKHILNADNKMVSLEVEYIVKAAGAGYHNGIGFQMELDPSFISSVSGSSIESNYLTLDANGTEAGQSKASIIMLDNVYNIMDYPGAGIGINTSPSAPYVQPESVNVTIEFSEPVLLTDAGFAPYNPFIIVDGDRGREVHLPGYPPTDLVDTSFFGTMNDDTNLSLGKYYLTKVNLPWGINLPESFDYPVEGEEILQAYLRFGQWAQSSGFSFMDWYTDKVGYRDASKVYSAQ